jgi:hypothetical protein
LGPTWGAPHKVQTHILLQSHTPLSCHTIFKPINSSWHQNQTHKFKFIQAHTDIKRLLQILVLPQVYHTLESTAYNIYHCRHSWRFQEHAPSICLDSNFHTIITHTHSSYQMYIVLTFDSLFMVHMLTYVLTKFNTRSANNLQ